MITQNRGLTAFDSSELNVYPVAEFPGIRLIQGVEIEFRAGSVSLSKSEIHLRRYSRLMTRLLSAVTQERYLVEGDSEQTRRNPCFVSDIRVFTDANGKHRIWILFSAFAPSTNADTEQIGDYLKAKVASTIAICGSLFAPRVLCEDEIGLHLGQFAEEDYYLDIRRWQEDPITIDEFAPFPRLVPFPLHFSTHEAVLSLMAEAPSPITLSLRISPTPFTSAEKSLLLNPPLNDHLAAFYEANTTYAYWSAVQVHAKDAHFANALADCFIAGNSVSDFTDFGERFFTYGESRLAKIHAYRLSERRVARMNLSLLEFYPWGFSSSSAAQTSRYLESTIQPDIVLTDFVDLPQYETSFIRKQRDYAVPVSATRFRSLLSYPEVRSLWVIPIRTHFQGLDEDSFLESDDGDLTLGSR